MAPPRKWPKEAQNLIYGLVPGSSMRQWTDVRYVGKSTTGHYRPQGHGAPSYLAKHAHLPVCRWIQKLRLTGDSMAWIALEISDSKDLGALESFWIFQLRGLGLNLLNLTHGGDGAPGWIPTAKNRANISAGLKNSESMQRAWKAQLGKPRTRQERIAMSRGHGGRPIVDQFGNRYETLVEAARAISGSIGDISSSLSGKRLGKPVKGHYFRYLNEGGDGL